MADERAKAEPDAQEFHYHYSARKESRMSPGGRRMLDVTGKVFLSGAIAMGGVFLGGFLLVGILVLGSFSLFLGGGTIFCLSVAGYLLSSGWGTLAASAFTGLGVCGLGLVAIAVTMLFGLATRYWVKDIIPTAHRQYRKALSMFDGREEGR